MTEKKHSRRDDEAARGGRRGRAAGHAAQAGGAPAPEATAGGAGGAAEAHGDAAADDAVARLTAERDEYLDHLRRLKAEFDNYRKRVRREQEELRLRAGEDVVESLLPVVDNIGRALEAGARHEEGQLIAGLELVKSQLEATLAAHGLEAVPTAPGDVFDPTVHEAVMTRSSDDHDEGAVLEVLEPGYLLHGRLLRPAKVVVAR